MKIWVLLFAALASAAPVVAQEVSATPPLVPARSQTTILETLFKAGPVMIPLVLLSIFFVMLVVVYLMTIRRGAVVSTGYMATADALLRKRDYLGLLAVSNRHGEAIARVVQKVLDFMTKNPQAELHVFGIIHSFGALGADIGSARYVALSRGISEALVNTAAGLAIGIPAMIFYAFFRGRAQKLISELEAASTHVLALLSLQYGRPQRTPVLIEEEL